MLWWTLGYTCLFQFRFPWCVCPAVGLLVHLFLLSQTLSFSSLLLEQIALMQPFPKMCPLDQDFLPCLQCSSKFPSASHFLNMCQNLCNNNCLLYFYLCVYSFCFFPSGIIRVREDVDTNIDTIHIMPSFQVSVCKHIDKIYQDSRE